MHGCHWLRLVLFYKKRQEKKLCAEKYVCSRVKSIGVISVLLCPGPQSRIMRDPIIVVSKAFKTFAVICVDKENCWVSVKLLYLT